MPQLQFYILEKEKKTKQKPLLPILIIFLCAAVCFPAVSVGHFCGSNSLEKDWELWGMFK